MTDRAVLVDALLSANGMAQALFALDGRVLVANLAFTAALGGRPDEVEGRRADEAGFPGTVAASLLVQIRRIASTGTPVTLSLPPVGELVLSPVRDADGVVTGVAALGDATVALLSARAEADRARAEAERTRTAAGRFLSVASHDLRQPFQAMHLFHHLLLGRLTDPGTRDLANKLVESIAGAEDLLRAVLDVASLDAGRFSPQAQTVTLDETFGRLLQDYAPEAEAKGLRFNVRPTVDEVVTDPILLERMLRPILDNAVRYTDAGRILLAARRRGDALRVEVWDTGIGIPESEQPAVFEDFRQLDDPNRGAKRGLGLGLAIVRRMAALLGLAVSVRSRPGKGSVFTVSLPLAGAAAARVRGGAMLATATGGKAA